MIDNLLNGTFKYEDVYEKHLLNQVVSEAQRRESHRKIQGVYYFSVTKLLQCFLRQFLSKKLKRLPSLDGLKIMDFGEMNHQWHQSVLSKEFGKIHRAERSFTYTVEEGKLYIAGRVDDLFAIPVQKDDELEYICMELKTQGFSVAKRKYPKIEHVAQLTFYMASIGSTKGYLVYISRAGFPERDDDLDKKVVTKTFFVDLDWDSVSELIERARSMYNYYEHDKLPPPESRMQRERSSECSYCEVKKECDFLMNKRQELVEKNAETWIDIHLLFPEVFPDDNSYS
ncbi:MAG: PD-(D/E)XK nuclease family protein [Candidatus Nanoarchaeia archaeon]